MLSLVVRASFAFSISISIWISIAIVLVAGCSSKSDAPTPDAATDALDARDETVVWDLGIDDADAGCGLPEPTEGAPCNPVGLDCGGYGSKSCPEHATCTADGWRITCPAYAFGTTNPCGCPHPGG
jgi:hypothetical protein